MVFGNFGELYEKSKEYNIDDVICLSKLKNNECPYYFGVEITPNVLYEINTKHKAWKMNVTLPKTPTQYAFFVYLFIEWNHPDYYKCVSVTNSPPFKIVSNRRYYSNKSIADESEILESSFCIKSKKDPNMFKFDHLLPHIFDKNTSDSVISKNNSVNEKIVIEKKDEEISKVLKEAEYLRPNRLYEIHTNIGQVDMKVVEDTEISMEREELSYFGENVEDVYKNGKEIEYLDSLGNKCIILTFPGANRSAEGDSSEW